MLQQCADLSGEDRTKLAGLTAEEAGCRDRGDTKAMAAVAKKKRAFYDSKGRQSFVWLFLSK